MRKWVAGQAMVSRPVVAAATTKPAPQGRGPERERSGVSALDFHRAVLQPSHALLVMATLAAATHSISEPLSDVLLGDLRLADGPDVPFVSRHHCTTEGLSRLSE